MKQRVKLFIFILIIWGVLGVTACANPVDKITIIEAERPELKGFGSFVGSMTVKNDNLREVSVESATFTLFYKGREMIGLYLAEPVGVPARATSRVSYELVLDKVSFSTLMALPSAMSSPEFLTLDIVANVKYGTTGKKIELKKVPLLDYIN